MPFKDKFCSDALGADHIDVLPVSGNDLFDDRQSKTGAFLVFAAGAVDLIETFPDLVDAGFRDPDAMVLD